MMVAVWPLKTVMPPPMAALPAVSSPPGAADNLIAHEAAVADVQGPAPTAEAAAELAVP